MTERQPLTDRQRAVYDFIRDHIREHHNAPTMRQIISHFGMKSPNGAMCHLNALEQRGWIEREHYASRGIRLKGVTILLVDDAT